MGRPRKEEGAKAVDLLEEAFFDQLADTPFEKLTISGVAKAAGVNRNSFYYHYTDMNDLALSAVNGLLLSDIPRLMASGLGPDSKELDTLLTGAVQHGNYRKMMIIIGPNSTEELRGVLKQSISDLWLGTFNLEPEDLNTEESATMSFTMAGALELAAKTRARIQDSDAESGADLRAIARTAELPIMQVCSKMMARALKQASRRKAERGSPVVAEGGWKPEFLLAKKT